MTLNQKSPPSQTLSLRWLSYTARIGVWLTGFMTVFAIIGYAAPLLTNYGLMSLGNIIVSGCAMIALGGIIGLSFMALSKFIEIWAEMIDSSHYKTMLLETLFTYPDEQRQA